jgi:endoglucanase
MTHRLGGISRRDFLKTGAACAVAANAPGFFPGLAKAAAPGAPLWGVNLAGADFGNLPGKHGTEYLYPAPANIDYYAGLGFTLVRIPFKWERLQPQLNAPLDASELSLLAGVVDHGLRRDLTVVLDPHNYAKRRLAEDRWQQEFHIGSAEVPLSGFLDFWGRLADVFKGRDRIAFGLMNEPVGVAPGAWLEIANAAIGEIRKRGARNLLLVPGTAYTGAHSWFTEGNHIMEGLKDPLGNFALEVHQYMDRDSSGTKPEVVSSTAGSERIEAFQDWARSRGFRAFLGEYCAGRNDLSARALMDLCDALNANPDVWWGSAAWAGGPRWPEDDMFNLEPYKDGRIREQTDIIRSRAKPENARRYWSGATPTLYADLARGIAIGLEGARTELFSRDGSAAGLKVGSKGFRADVDGDIHWMDSVSAVLFRLPAFTVIIETRYLPNDSRKSDILSFNDASLLHRSAEGALRTDFGGGLATSRLTPDAWKTKRRCSFSFNAATGETAIAITGAAPVRGKEARPAFTDGQPGLRLGSGPHGVLKGYVTRIIGFPSAFSDAELAQAVA